MTTSYRCSSATGAPSLLGDLLANARLVVRTLTHPRQGPLLKAVIAVVNCDEDTAAGLATFYATRIAEWAPCVRQAIDRGEVLAGTGLLDEAAADQAARAAAKAGVQ